MKKIPLSRHGKNKGKYCAFVDDEDYEYLMQWSWRISRENSDIIYARSGKGKEDRRIMHREIMKRHNLLDETKIIDHKNRNGLDNQKSNLRNCTYQQNSRNKRSFGKSKYSGVSIASKWGKRKNKLLIYWRAGIQVGKTRFHLGMFKTEEEAALAYNIAAQKHFGEFAHLNTIKPLLPDMSNIMANQN